MHIKVELRPIIEKGHVGTASYEESVTKGLKTDASVSKTLQASIEASANYGIGKMGAKLSTDIKGQFSISYSSTTTQKVTYTVAGSDELYLYQAVVVARTNHGRILEFGGQLKSFSTPQSLVEEINTDVAESKRAKMSFAHLQTRSGKCLAVFDNSSEKGKHIISWSWVDEPGQKWKFEGDHIVNGHGYYLAVDGNNPGNDARLCQWTKTDEEGQKWSMTSDGHIRNGHGKYLAVSANSGDDGAAIITWDRREEANQCWHLAGG